MILAVTGYLFYRIPGSLLPDEDQGTLFGVAVMPPAASLRRTTAAMDQAAANVGRHPAVQNVFAVAGFDILAGGLKTSAGTMFITLKDWGEREDPSLDARNLPGTFIGMNAAIKDAMLLFFIPPPISGLSTAGGFELYVQDRTGSGIQSLSGALIAAGLCGLTNDVYFQIGLVTLIGLAAKNAILTVEFAVLRRQEGLSALEAAVEGAQLRFRPIVMTSLAFILGVLPLAISTGAGSASRHSIGTGVIGGMLAATFVATFFIPMFYRLIAWREPRSAASGRPRSDTVAVDQSAR